MPAPLPARPTEADLERASFLAIASEGRSASTEIASQHARATYAQGGSNQSYVLSSASIDSSLIASMSAIDAQVDVLTGNGRASADNYEASVQADYLAAEAANQVAATVRDSAADLAVVAASRGASVQRYAEEASIRDSLRLALAAKSASSASADATVRSTASYRVATSQSTSSLAEARIRAAAMATMATIRYDTTITVSGHQSDASYGVALAQYDSETIIATIRSDSDRRSADASSAASSLVSAARTRDTAQSAAQQSRETTQSALARNQARATIASADATNQGLVSAEGSRSRRLIADLRSVASRRADDIGFASDVASADSQSTAARRRTDYGSTADRTTANLSFNADAYEASAGRDASLSVATTRAAADNYQSDSRYESVAARQAGENRRLLRSLAYADARFSEAWAALALLDSDESQASLVPPAPYVRRAWSVPPSIARSRANRARAESDSKAEASWVDASRDAAGRGVGGASPMVHAARLSAKAAGLRESGLAANAARVAAGKANSEAALEAAGAYAGSVAARNSALLAAESSSNRRRVSVLSDLASAIASAVR
jgi:trimeric autotransporter adhesin